MPGGGAGSRLLSAAHELAGAATPHGETTFFSEELLAGGAGKHPPTRREAGPQANPVKPRVTA